MNLQEFVSLRPKTTMHVGGEARYYAELSTKEDAEQAWNFSKEKGVPLIVLGGGSNTIFADGVIEALVVRVAAKSVDVDGTSVRAEAGAYLASLVSDLAKRGLDLSPLAGIPGSIGGAVFGNAGQGPKGVWTDSFVEEVTVFSEGKWRTFPKGECEFRYRESAFKAMRSPVVWSVNFSVPERPSEEILRDIQALLKRRAESQPAANTAGSCFKGLPDGTPAWKLLDAAKLRGKKQGGIGVSEKHANFLVNDGTGTFKDAVALVSAARGAVSGTLELEMRFVDEHGEVLR